MDFLGGKPDLVYFLKGGCLMFLFLEVIYIYI